MVQEILLSQQKTVKRLIQEQFHEEQSLSWRLLKLRMKTALSLCPQFKPMEIHGILSSKTSIIQALFFLDFKLYYSQNCSMISLNNQIFKRLITWLEINQHLRWSQQQNGMKKCSTSINFTQLITIQCILNTQLFDQRL